jgi:hypothetical protein
VLISSADYLALEETTHLLRAPANARHLLESLKQARPVNNGRLDDYTVVMVTPMSIRFRRPQLLERLKAEAGARNVSTSALAEELIEEGLRARRHPMIVFRDGASGRRAGLIGGPDVWEVVGGLVGGDVPPEDRISRAAEHLGLSLQQTNAVLDYYADFTTEIDEEIAENVAAADELEAAWLRRQGLLAG